MGLNTRHFNLRQIQFKHVRQALQAYCQSKSTQREEELMQNSKVFHLLLPVCREDNFT